MPRPGAPAARPAAPGRAPPGCRPGCAAVRAPRIGTRFARFRCASTHAMQTWAGEASHSEAVSLTSAASRGVTLSRRMVAVAPGPACSVYVLARQYAPVEDSPHEDAKSEARGHRQQLSLRVAAGQAVRKLDGRWSCPAPQLGDRARPGDDPVRCVRNSNRRSPCPPRLGRPARAPRGRSA